MAHPPLFVPSSTRDDGFRVVSERVTHSRYVTLYDRTVEFPAQTSSSTEGSSPLQFAYDVLGHPKAGFHFVSVFPVHTNNGGEIEATLVREYGQVRFPVVLPSSRPGIAESR
jgi:hypothetical protein